MRRVVGGKLTPKLNFYFPSNQTGAPSSILKDTSETQRQNLEKVAGRTTGITRSAVAL